MFAFCYSIFNQFYIVEVTSVIFRDTPFCDVSHVKLIIYTILVFACHFLRQRTECIGHIFVLEILSAVLSVSSVVKLFLVPVASFFPANVQGQTTLVL